MIDFAFKLDTMLPGCFSEKIEGFDGGCMIRSCTNRRPLLRTATKKSKKCRGTKDDHLQRLKPYTFTPSAEDSFVWIAGNPAWILSHVNTVRFLRQTRERFRLRSGAITVPMKHQRKNKTVLVAVAVNKIFPHMLLCDQCGLTSRRR